ncbi:hypothetical protein BS17DRAFT_844439 [Gyrodon lividus]|nr:hypothetical protein BS17DRAFT_844439 [Gyrodon lividus]
MCELAEVMQITLQFSMTLEQVDKVKEQVINWVEKYEKCVLLPILCRVSSGLLHLASSIRHCGPVWTTWMFYMECFCAMLQNPLKSHSQPWSNLNKSLLHVAYLEQLGVRYDLSDELAQLDDQTDDGAIGYERVKHYLLPPSFSAGKLRIQNAGDTFRTRFVTGQALPHRETVMSGYYEVVFQPHTGPVVRQISHGNLEKIVVLTLPTNDFFGNLSGRQLALALITPWDTQGNIASKDNMFLKSRRASIITDVRSLQAVIGLVETRNKWAIIDRVPETVATNFTEENAASDDDMMGIVE